MIFSFFKIFFVLKNEEMQVWNDTKVSKWNDFMYVCMYVI